MTLPKAFWYNTLKNSSMTQKKALLNVVFLGKYSLNQLTCLSRKQNLTPYCEDFDLFVAVHHCFWFPKYKVKGFYNEEFFKMTFLKQNTFIF